MTPTEWHMVSVLYRVKMTPCSSEKRFVRDAYARGKEYGLSEKQRIWLAQLHSKYRRQVNLLEVKT